jgi:hypothetical protein
MDNKYLQRQARGHPARCCIQCTYVLVLRVAEPPSPKGKLQWVVCPPHPSEATPEIHDVWAYRLEAASPSKTIK